MLSMTIGSYVGDCYWSINLFIRFMTVPLCDVAGLGLTWFGVMQFADAVIA